MIDSEEFFTEWTREKTNNNMACRDIAWILFGQLPVPACLSLAGTCSDWRRWWHAYLRQIIPEYGDCPMAKAMILAEIRGDVGKCTKQQSEDGMPYFTQAAIARMCPVKVDKYLLVQMGGSLLYPGWILRRDYDLPTHRRALAKLYEKRRERREHAMQRNRALKENPLHESFQEVARTAHTFRQRSFHRFCQEVKAALKSVLYRECRVDYGSRSVTLFVERWASEFFRHWTCTPPSEYVPKRLADFELGLHSVYLKYCKLWNASAVSVLTDLKQRYPDWGLIDDFLKDLRETDTRDQTEFPVGTPYVSKNRLVIFHLIQRRDRPLVEEWWRVYDNGVERWDFNYDAFAELLRVMGQECLDDAKRTHYIAGACGDELGVFIRTINPKTFPVGLHGEDLAYIAQKFQKKRFGDVLGLFSELLARAQQNTGWVSNCEAMNQLRAALDSQPHRKRIRK